MTIARPLQVRPAWTRWSRISFVTPWATQTRRQLAQSRTICPTARLDSLSAVDKPVRWSTCGHRTTHLSGETTTWRPQLSIQREHQIAARYSTSKQPHHIANSHKPNTPQKKPLLKALGELTPHENIYTIPNILTFSRLVAAPIVGYLVLHDYHAWAFGLFAYAGITDLVDGYIARRWNLQTVVGTVIDPMADKTLMTILTVCLAVKGALPVWLAVIILGRDVGLAITAIYYRWISLPPPKTFARYWDFSLPSAEVRPTTISKYNTALQLGLIGATTAMPLVTVDINTAMTAMQYVVATTTVWSGASYIYAKDAVKILNQEGKDLYPKSKANSNATRK